MKKSILSSLVFASLLFMSCSSNDVADCTGSQFSSDVGAAAQNLSAASQAWAANPALCSEFVAAANDYLDVVESFSGCGAVSQTNYDAQVAAARAAISSLPAC